jgi:hypothetical protein
VLLEIFCNGYQSGHSRDKVYPSHAWMHELIDSKLTLKNSLPHMTVNKNNTHKKKTTEKKSKKNCV